MDSSISFSPDDPVTLGSLDTLASGIIVQRQLGGNRNFARFGVDSPSGGTRIQLTHEFDGQNALVVLVVVPCTFTLTVGKLGGSVTFAEFISLGVGSRILRLTRKLPLGIILSVC